MAAEAENELGNTAAAWTYMQPVLNRVLPAAKVSALQAKYTASQQAFREGIYDQRALEFAGESLRKPDLVRWGIIDEKMEQAKTKLRALQQRTGDYAGLPDKVYINNAEDKDAIVVYGLNKGEDNPTDDMKETWESKNWFISSDKFTLEDTYINGLYTVKPSTHYLWPIWETFIGKSNNMLNNDGNLGQL